MIVNNKKKGMLIVPLSLAVGDIGKGVMPAISNINLLPGFNEIKDSDWEKLKPSLQYKLDSKELEVISEKKVEVVKEGKGDKATTKEIKKEKALKFSELTIDKIKEILPETNDVKLLEKWSDGEKRDDVRLMIRKRIEEVEDYIKTGKQKSKDK